MHLTSEFVCIRCQAQASSLHIPFADTIVGRAMRRPVAATSMKVKGATTPKKQKAKAKAGGVGGTLKDLKEVRGHWCWCG